MGRAYFRLFFDQYLPLTEGLTYEEVGRLFMGAMYYLQDDVQPELPGRESIVWGLLKKDIDKDRAKYEAKCAANAKNGQKGGRPRKETESFPAQEPNQSQSEQTKANESDRFFSPPTGLQSKESKQAKQANKSTQSTKSKQAAKSKPRFQRTAPCCAMPELPMDEASYVARMKQMAKLMRREDPSGP